MIGNPLLLEIEGEGSYFTNIKDLGPGCYQITAETAVPQRPEDAVTDITLVWDQEAAKESGIE